MIPLTRMSRPESCLFPNRSLILYHPGSRTEPDPAGGVRIRHSIAKNGRTGTKSTFCRDFSPRTILTSRRATPRHCAMKSMSALFAAPSTGRAEIRTLRASPCAPANSLRAAPGWMCTAISTPLPCGRSQAGNVSPTHDFPHGQKMPQRSVHRSARASRSRAATGAMSRSCTTMRATRGVRSMPPIGGMSFWNGFSTGLARA